MDEDEWRDLRRKEDERLPPTGQQYAEAPFVPNWIGHSKNSPEHRSIAIREPFRNPPLQGMESQAGLSPHVMETADGGWCKVFGIVTNRDLGPEELVRWRRPQWGQAARTARDHALGLPGGLLIYAQGEADTASYTVRGSGTRLEVAALDLTGTLEEILEAVRQMAKSVVRFRNEARGHSPAGAPSAPAPTR